MACFGDPNFWEDRFEHQQGLDTICEWFGGYRDLEPQLREVLDPRKSVLFVGPGTSRLHEEIYDSGVIDVACADVSVLLINHLQEKNRYQRGGLRYYQCDVIKGIDFRHSGFDVVIDKGTIDCIMCRDDGIRCAKQVIQNVYNVLLPEGIFCMASNSGPERRESILKCCSWGKFSVEKCHSPNIDTFVKGSPHAEKHPKEFYVYKLQKPGNEYTKRHISDNL